MLDDAIYTLRLHAEGSEEGNRRDLLADSLQMAKNGLPYGSLGPIWTDIVGGIEGARESIALDRATDDCFTHDPDQLVQAVSRMVSMCLDFFASQEYDWDARHEFLMLGWRINCAWDAINSGITGNLAEHVENEAQDRQFVD